jgi:hypothetical protein
MEKLLKQLQRDFKRNPKKAGMLGLLFLVCGWFWLPLILPKEEKKPVKPTAATSAATAVVAVPAAASAAPAMRWQDLSRVLENDPRMKSFTAPIEVARRDPFTEKVVEHDVDAEFNNYVAGLLAEEDAELTITPEEASPLLDSFPLSLSSTIVGGRTPRAVINGRAFDRGAVITTRNELPVVVSVIEPRRVIIEWNGSRRELRILRPGETPPLLGAAPLRK